MNRELLRTSHTVCHCTTGVSTDAHLSPGDCCEECGSPRWDGRRWDDAALQGAANLLKLRLPVRLEVDPYMQPEKGGYLQGADGHEHLIVMNTNRSLDAANQGIAHELIHAHQRERDGFERSDRLYSTYEARRGYEDNPYEVEARRYQGPLADRFQIVLGGDR